ncbi:hypothetical protein HanXRQr2_Chr11g0466781 [Helianthus annuus]|uniref:Uncharacterized protein n=1 Tax=Helianthus annuus TaxID=4232 RepID=A0A9K3HK96_HELAN|nr:hypothetical protein HanXRQr2_Chr11g0466781 [Helianthus annuus]
MVFVQNTIQNLFILNQHVNKTSLSFNFSHVKFKIIYNKKKCTGKYNDLTPTHSILINYLWQESKKLDHMCYKNRKSRTKKNKNNIMFIQWRSLRFLTEGRKSIYPKISIEAGGRKRMYPKISIRKLHT